MGGWGPGDIYFDQDTKYQWKTRGENCHFCDIMEGRIYTLDTYSTSSIYPGFHRNCDCYLIKVDQTAEESDMDIFGSALNMRNNAWIELFFGVRKDLWMPGYIEQPAELLAFAKPGMTAREAMQLLVNQDKTRFGMFKDFGFPGNIYYPWNVHRNVNLQYQNWDQLLTSWAGTFPKPAPVKPVLPAQTYHNTLWKTAR